MKSIFVLVVTLSCFRCSFAAFVGGTSVGTLSGHLRAGPGLAQLAGLPVEADDAQVPNTWSFVQEQAGKKGSGILMFMLCLFCCCCCVMPIVFFVLTTYVFIKVASKAIDEITNDVAKDMRESFDKECPEEEKAQYCGKEFKDKCDKLFNEADKNGDGKLSLAELKEPMKAFCGDVPQVTDMYLKAIDTNADSSIDKDEFFELMKYLQFKKDLHDKETAEKAPKNDDAKEPLKA
jgi:Ca2+-binding EF-hand superfamily protein